MENDTCEQCIQATKVTRNISFCLNLCSSQFMIQVFFLFRNENSEMVHVIKDKTAFRHQKIGSFLRVTICFVYNFDK